jgi:hypothetical protein
MEKVFANLVDINPKCPCKTAGSGQPHLSPLVVAISEATVHKQ